ncbi:MAG: GNAT family acetyltransferase [Tissierellia bacterium]|nr:GNAT family acetyltransferase [Tissierellia bacterium]
MNYRQAKIEDIPQIEKLQKRYHVDTISDEDRPNGFVTTLFTTEQFKNLITEEDGLTIALDGDKIIGYAMAASWDYWSQWPLFQHMIKDLPNMEFHGTKLDTKNSFQYGPICVDAEYRGSDVFPNLFETSRLNMKERFPILVTFINRVNPRSLRAHEKLELEIIKPFEFNNNNYYALGYDMEKKTPNSTL